MTEAMPATVLPLAGKRILVTAFDLEQREHRGIAMYTKKLLAALAQSGAEVWLLTEKSSSLKAKAAKLTGQNAANAIAAAHILEQLAYGKTPAEPGSLLALAADYVPGIRWLQARREISKKVSVAIAPKSNYKAKDIKLFSLSQLKDNPYLREERMSYLSSVAGIVSAPGIFTNSMSLALRLPQKKAKIETRGFDALITTCPLNISHTGSGCLVQTIHDIIPVEYVSHNEDQIVFINRLKACISSPRLFVSSSTCHKFHSLCSASMDITSLDHVIVQPSTLEFDNNIHKRAQNSTSMFPNPAVKGMKGELTPLRYFLFNSSVEKRKNLLLAIKAYNRSNLATQGIKLCITGALKQDRYSDEVRRWTHENSMILLTDYVDDYTKSELFLNALGLVSTSLVEGFGIPVLDAACLGLPVIASESASHAEIASMKDFEQYVWLCSTQNSSDWSEAMQIISKKMEVRRQQSQQDKLVLEVLQERLKRFGRMSKEIESDFRRHVADVMKYHMAKERKTAHQQAFRHANNEVSDVLIQGKAGFSALS